MGVDVTGPGLLREVNAWKAKNQPVHTRWERIVREYHTPAFRSDSVGTSSPENYRFTFTLHTTARFASGRSVVKLSSRNKATDSRVEELELAGDAWLQDSHFDETLQRAIADQCLQDMAVLMVTQRTRRGFEQHDDPPKTPGATIIPPDLFIYDVYAPDMRSCEIQGHVVIVSKDKLVREAQENPEEKWDLAAIAKLVVDSTTKDYRKDADVAVPRGEIVYYELWVSGYELPEIAALDEDERKKYHGTIFTISAPDGAELKPPRGWFGPPDGPYCVRGVMVVPREARYLSMLTACEGQIEQCNAQARANDTAATNRKAFAVIDASTPEAKAAVLNVIDGQVLTIPGLSQSPNAIQVVEVGGITAQAHQREIDLRGRVERNLAMGDALNGQASGIATATENVIAAQASAGVATLVDAAVYNLAADVVRRALWFFDQDYRSGMVVDGAVHTGGSTYEEKKAGIEHALLNKMIEPEEAKQAIEALGDLEGPQGTIDDLDITVESVRADAKEEARLTAANNILLQWAPLAPAVAQYAPGADAFFKRVAQGIQVPEAGEFFDFAQAAQVMAEQQAAMQQQDTPPRTAPGPQSGAPPRALQSQQQAKPAESPVKIAAKVGA